MSCEVTPDQELDHTSAAYFEVVSSSVSLNLPCSRTLFETAYSALLVNGGGW